MMQQLFRNNLALLECIPSNQVSPLLDMYVTEVPGATYTHVRNRIIYNGHKIEQPK